MNQPFDPATLNGQVAIVTGASRGVGRAATLALAKHGVRVAAVARNKEQLAATVEQVHLLGGEILPLSIDLAFPDNGYSIVKKVIRDLGDLHILINNAAILGPLEYLTDVDYSDWVKVINTNLNGPFALTQAAVRYMITARYGRIINLVCDLCEHGLPRLGPYSVSKAALIQTTQVFGQELKSFGITVNGIDPGQVATDLRSELHGALSLEESAKSIAPEAVAPVLVLLASQAASEITGKIGTLDFFTRLLNGLGSPK